LRKDVRGTGLQAKNIAGSRAGRPQFDTEGVAVIMTDRKVNYWQRKHQFTVPHKVDIICAFTAVLTCCMNLQNVHRYEALSAGAETVESQLKVET
jgi:hypothetical protein